MTIELFGSLTDSLQYRVNGGLRFYPDGSSSGGAGPAV
jgi:hypothetical protein